MNLSRSPYIIEVDDATQTGSKVELFLWNTGSIPADPQYTLTKLIPDSKNTKKYYNISPSVREYYKFLSFIHISEPARLRRISYAVTCLKNKIRSQHEKTNN